MLQSPEAPQDCQVLGLPGHLKKLLSSEFCKKLFSHILLKPPCDSNIPEIQNENFLWRLGILGPAEGIYLWVPMRKSRGCFERVPVFEGTFRLRQDLQVATAADFSNSLGSEGKTITIAGKLEYQACDSKICFTPTSVPVQWQLQVLPLDRQRAPENIQHKQCGNDRRDLP